jgi:hypothetical protein
LHDYILTNNKKERAMKKIAMIMMVVMLLSASNVFALDDVLIDSSGNVTIGISNSNANLEVTGASGEHGVVGETSGSGAAGVYGINTTNNNYGILGYAGYGVYGEGGNEKIGYLGGPLYGVYGEDQMYGNYGYLGSQSSGVYGYSGSGNAGYFEGNARVTGNLTVDGSISGSGLGDITGVTAGTGLSGGGMIGDVTLNVDAAVAMDSEIMPAVLANDGAGSTLDADKLDGMDSTDFAVSLHSHTGSLYGKTAIVAQSGGDYTSPLDAMTDIAGWCGTPSSTNPCMVKIMPGIYDLGNNGLTMQSYVDIEGSGENTTIITSTHSSGSWDAASATVAGADNAEMRFLSIENQGGSTYSIAIYNSYASPDVTHVIATAYGGSHSYGTFNSTSAPSMTNVTANASGVSNSVGIYNSLSSPVMENVNATASGGGTNRGVFNVSFAPEMTNVRATASGGSINYGVHNFNTSSPSMNNVTAEASGGSSFNYGVYNQTSSPVINNSITIASGGSSSFGVYNKNSSLPELVNVSINGIIITGRQLFVPASGTDAENGTLLLAANNEITGLGAASAANRYTIKLDAGTYDLGNNELAMQSYVDIEGSGENTTTITSTHSNITSNVASATVSGADNAEIRFLTVENQGGSTNSIAIFNNTASPDITNVTANGFGGSSGNIGVRNNDSSPAMTNVTATASGGDYAYGVLNFNASSPSMTNITANASGGTLSRGMQNTNASPTIKTSSIGGTTGSIFNTGSTAKIGATMLEGPVTGAGFTCVGAYDETFTALNNSCL